MTEEASMVMTRGTTRRWLIDGRLAMAAIRASIEATAANNLATVATGDNSKMVTWRQIERRQGIYPGIPPRR